MNSYPCPPLPKTTIALRLFELHPSSNPPSTIRGRLFESSSISNAQLTYEALSYVWGDEAVVSTININNQPFTVTTNLAEALRALRKTDCVRKFWIDAICINQDDLDEKSKQVQRMWEIYEAASSVVVWLGLHDGGSEAVMSQMNSYQSFDSIASSKESKHDVQVDGNTYHDGLINISARPWFSRIWTLQEVAAAKDIQITCGNTSVDGRVFCNQMIETAYQDKRLDQHFRRIRPAIELMGGSSLAFRPFGSPLIALIERFRSWDAKKPVDKVYSLLGFSSDARSMSRLRPDYSLSPCELARKLIEFSFPSANVVSKTRGTSPQNTVRFGIQGVILGTIMKETSDTDKKTFWFQHVHTQKAVQGLVNNDHNLASSTNSASLSSSTNSLPSRSRSTTAETTNKPTSTTETWKIDILNERELSQNSLVCLLRNAFRPTILRVDQQGSYEVEMLATTVPYLEKTYSSVRDRQDSLSHDATDPDDRSWDDLLKYYQGDFHEAVEFELEWSPF